ncbi:ribonuclease HII [Spirochaeta dissipatitropha]
MHKARSTELVCGVDEAGRGPLAGPVTASAVILPENFPIEILRDSKKMSASRRAYAETVIRSSSLAFGIGWAWPEEIDSINILQASLCAMQRAVSQLYQACVHRRDPSAIQFPSQPESIIIRKADDSSWDAVPLVPDLILVDGNRCPEFSQPSQAEIKGDDRIPEIMAASILAKTARDRWMTEADEVWPGYGFSLHKGYPTAAHKKAIQLLGPSPIHRRSFRGAGVLS